MSKQLPKEKKLEVPKVINVKIADGILVCTDGKATPLGAIFKHIQDSMNDKNSVDAVKALAKAHGFDIEVEA